QSGRRRCQRIKWQGGSRLNRDFRCRLMRPPRNYFVRAFKRDAGMLSRVADSLYWMSRYLERAEHTARLLDVELQLWLDQSPEAGAGRWRFLLEALRTSAASGGPIDPTLLVDQLVFSRRNSSSIVS